MKQSCEILNIKNLSVNIDNTPIINNLNLSIKSGEIHVIMGKNGSGKSTLAKVIAGHPQYHISNGSIILNSIDITKQDPETRSHNGLFLGFQYPIEIPGVNNIDFLRLAYNSKKRSNSEEELDPISFLNIINNRSNNLDLDQSFLARNVNEGFSGGEKKKNEILQMELLQPKLSILDEIDSGLDIDALKNIAYRIKQFSSIDNCIVLITHYQRLLNYIRPNYIHIMDKGNIIYTGDYETANKIEKYGYDIFM
uniref:Probable ATP-dependent transporter ycf16 n=1 Tax=Anotrichium furcellatum TaxID=41999 RepID=A0A4D6WL68_9FLOR|nr:iron-sulfur cluster formation ABC transporter ATP-binding subunit [Anotrichium furcellatum]